MAYSIDVIRRARQRLESDKADRASLHRERLQEAYREIPRLQEIDRLLQATMAAAAQAAFAGGRESANLMEEAKQANLALQAEKEAILAEHYPENWLLDGPICPKCYGEGYIGSDEAVGRLVRRLKAKLGRGGELIVSERGTGYRLLA